jgi:threonine/homoserine/homoserine lactone efflux protein
MWFEPVNFIDFIFKGLVVGVVASAPMGPVGVLCVQRTLNKGRWYGFVTGIGAALSDIIYALMTG